jgi:trehalose 6-phosphate phosphatase
MFKRNLAKFNQAMGFQRSSYWQKVQPGSDLSTKETAPNSSHPVTNEAVSDDADYSSWMVSPLIRIFSLHYSQTCI